MDSTVQGVAYVKLAQALNPQSVILIISGVRYSIKIVNYASKKYIRNNFRSEIIFSDAVDATFFSQIKLLSI